MGLASMQGAREHALLSVEQRCIQHPAKTGTFSSFPNLREAAFQKNTQHLCFWSRIFPHTHTPCYGLLISIFQFQSSEDIFWAQRTHVILPLTAVQMYVCI